MINVKFKYKKQKLNISCNLEEKIIDACKKFTTQIQTDLETKLIFFNDDKINIDSKDHFFDLITEPVKPGEDQKYEIKFYDDPDKLYKVVLDIEGNKKVVRAKKGDSLMGIFQKAKINFQNFFFVKGGDKVGEQDYGNRLSILTDKYDNENKEINLLGYKNEFSEENDNNQDNNDLINKDNSNNINKNENTNCSNEKILNINDSQNEKICNDNSNEKIYKEDNSKEKPSDEKEDNKVNVNNDRTKSDKEHFTEEDIIKILQKIYLYLIIEIGIIIVLVWLGCFFHINEAFIKSIGTILGTFIPVTVVMGVMLPWPIIFDKYDFGCCLSFIYILLYEFSITFLCYLLTNFTDYKYILSVLFLFLLDFVILEVYLPLFKSTNVLGMMITNIITNTITVILYYYLWIENVRIIINISIIAFVFILYMSIIFFFTIDDYEDNKSNIQLTICFCYGIFFIITAIYLLIAFVIVQIREYYNYHDCCECCECCHCCGYCECNNCCETFGCCCCIFHCY